MRCSVCEGISKCRRSGVYIAQILNEFLEQRLSPDSSGNRVANCTPDVVRCEEDSGNDGEIYAMLDVAHVAI
jgi:hypothetical protein